MRKDNKKENKKDKTRFERITALKKWLKSPMLIGESGKPWRSLAKKAIRDLKSGKTD